MFMLWGLNHYIDFFYLCLDQNIDKQQNTFWMAYDCHSKEVVGKNMTWSDNKNKYNTIWTRAENLRWKSWSTIGWKIWWKIFQILIPFWWTSKGQIMSSHKEFTRAQKIRDENLIVLSDEKYDGKFVGCAKSSHIIRTRIEWRSSLV